MFSLEELVQIAFDSAKGIVERGQEAAPVLLIQTPTTVIPLLIAGAPAEKDALYRYLHGCLLNTGAISYALVMEGWTLTPEDAAQWDHRTRPSEHPRRVECLTVTGFTSDGEGRMLNAYIEKPDGRRVVRAPMMCDGREALIQGTAADLFTPR